MQWAEGETPSQGFTGRTMLQGLNFRRCKERHKGNKRINAEKYQNRRYKYFYEEPFLVKVLCRKDLMHSSSSWQRHLHTQPSALRKYINIKRKDNQGQYKYWFEYFHLMLFIFCGQINIQLMPSRFHFLTQETMNKSITGKNISSLKTPIEWRGGVPSKSNQWSDNSNIHLRRVIT